ncbi:NADP-dependent oxidoreductase [Amycolatopsis sp. cmx-11-51]|uniref:NADP-dependent oxidoreductase n=1 Tax=unclassified Amycolatopsis TaxID=2618356 RepID=UPI0039E274E7
MLVVMRMIKQDAFGGPEVLHVVDAEQPVPGEGQVRVRVHAAGVNPADWKIRNGLVVGDLPLTVGLDFSGVVDSAGTRFRPGDEVYGVTFPPNGSYAEYIAVSEDTLAPKPKSLDHVEAAALPIAALTAWQPFTRLFPVGPGHRVLVHAAAGGVGHLAVQIAKARGAYVIGTAREAKHDFLRNLGADELIDYTTSDFAKSLVVDVVLDPISGDYGPRSLDTLKPGGSLIDIVGHGPDRTLVRRKAGELGLRFAEFYVSASGADLAEIAVLADAGSLRASIADVLPLEQAAKAHELSESGRVQGKLVLTI